MAHTLTAGDTSMTWEQTAEVLAKEVDRLQKENDRLIGAIRREIVYATYNPIIIARLEAYLSPTDEGGWAANGGKSKPLVITATVTEAMRNQWHLAKSGESQALQTAILGLHTLAGEFPTPTWKTREDYLQATISEINEILGKQ